MLSLPALLGLSLLIIALLALVGNTALFIITYVDRYFESHPDFRYRLTFTRE